MKFPTQGTVFDYYIDNETKKFELWTKKVPKFELDPDLPLQVCNTCLQISACNQTFFQIFISFKPILIT